MSPTASLSSQTSRDLQAILEILDQRLHELADGPRMNERTSLQGLRTQVAEVQSLGT